MALSKSYVSNFTDTYSTKGDGNCDSAVDTWYWSGAHHDAWMQPHDQIEIQIRSWSFKLR
jgi:hypothetical protein